MNKSTLTTFFFLIFSFHTFSQEIGNYFSSPNLSHLIKSAKVAGDDYVVLTSGAMSGEIWGRHAIMRLDNNGELISAVRSNVAENDVVSIVGLADGGFIYCRRKHYLVGVELTTVQKFDSENNEIWNYSYYIDISSSIGTFYEGFEDDDGNIYLCGKSTGHNATVLKINSEGEEIWTRRLNPYPFPQGSGAISINMIQLENGNIAVVGKASVSDNSSGECALSIINPNGVVIFNKSWGTNNVVEGFQYVMELDNGDVVVGGSSKVEAFLSESGIIARITQEGELVWLKKIDFVEIFEISSLSKVGDNEIMIFAKLVDLTDGWYDATAMIRMNADGDVLESSISNEGEIIHELSKSADGKVLFRYYRSDPYVFNILGSEYGEELQIPDCMSFSDTTFVIGDFTMNETELVPNSIDVQAEFYTNHPMNPLDEVEVYDLCEPISVSETSKINSGIKYYPNPANTELQLDFSELSSHFFDIEFTLINTLGQSVYNIQNINSIENIDVSRFESGLYIGQIWVENQILESIKIVIE